MASKKEEQQAEFEWARGIMALEEAYRTVRDNGAEFTDVVELLLGMEEEYKEDAK
jgi:hypothetical protein